MRTLGIFIVGLFGIYGGARAIMSGAINLGGKGRDYIVTFAQDPGLFIAGVLFFLALGVGCLAVVWKQWQSR